MRLVVTALPDGAVRLSSPDVPGGGHYAKGMEQTWRALRVLMQTTKGAPEGEWPADRPGGEVDELLADAEQARAPATRAQAAKVRAALERLARTVQEDRARLAAEEAAERKRAEVLREVEAAQAALAAAIAKAKAAGAPVRVNKPAVRPTPGKATGTRVVSSPEERAHRRQQITEQWAVGDRSAASIARSIGSDPKTVGNDIRTMRDQGLLT